MFEPLFMALRYNVNHHPEETDNDINIEKHKKGGREAHYKEQANDRNDTRALTPHSHTACPVL